MLPASGIRAVCFTLLLLAAAPCPAEDEDGEFESGRRYLVETAEGGVFTSEIADADGDSLYFVDGTTMPRAEVATVSRPGEWAGRQTLHPGPETRPPGSTLKVEHSAFLTLAEAVLSLLIAIFD